MAPDLLTAPPAVITVGAAVLDDALRAQGVPSVPVAWHPPVADPGDIAVLAADPRRAAANELAAARMVATHPSVVDVHPAGELVGIGRHQLLHAGPPIDWSTASGPMRGAIMGALLYEGWAKDETAAETLAASGTIELSPCHHHGAVGPMAGIVSPSMPMWVVTDGNRQTYSTLNEGLGKVLRYGAFGPAVTDRLRWMEHVLGPVLARALAAHGPVDLRALIAAMLAMGDEGHNRNRAGTSLFARELAADLVAHGGPADEVAAVFAFIAGNDHFLLNAVMAAAKLVADAGRDVAGSTVVVAMARNGTDFGIQVSGAGDEWFTGPASIPDGLYLGGYGPDDANPDIGDSTITETVGLGGFAMAAAPAIVALVGGTVSDALAWSREMHEIAVTEHPAWTIPVLGFRGVPVGIDVLRVVRTGILPNVNTGIAGRVAGTGQVGAGLVRPPLACFTTAAAALAARARGRA